MTTTKGKKIVKADVDKSKDEKPKSKTTLFREKYPQGIGYIVNMRAVLR